ncbi:5-formyltetrahydrofolate cyclo-ligase [Clostridium cavendishii DSM 21758]|uniref:5-formyltetrahydrofolate cyclo-ligase n=1 Tax=Clostridium cavendishii DSM 21758 TaxID=1121302 RepID=A0A1M6LTU5_9CLOT|nr:5-formyltetrahydrofolate cyclo-ligase [Clostridium cavendishii]SHJ74677.1 5-formyltetrahydrofolate cyclo-ligase [Clostridium cavendishii DSM 21758]
MDKKELRKLIKEKRLNLDRKEKELSDIKIAESFLKSAYFKECKTIFMYVSMEDEVETKEILKKALELGKHIYVPKVENTQKVMKALRINSLLDLNESGVFGILEPSIDNEELKEEADIILVPGLAFDLSGGRLGYGGGFYDKFLKNSKSSKRIALCYDFQIVDEVPMEEFDEKIDFIITENKVEKIIK